MEFPIPENATDLLIYIWKIIDLPTITKSDLINALSFELFLFTPKKAKFFIDRAIQSKLLITAPKGHLNISQKLQKDLDDWQRMRKKEISENLLIKKIKKIKKGSSFNTMLNFFADKGTISRAVGVSSSNFDIIDFSNEVIAANVIGTKEESYNISINTNDKIIKHNCHDFETRRSQEKKFCKHLVKLFFLLKDENQEQTEQFLSQIGENIDNWDFTV